MARGRFVSATIATDKRLNELSLESEYLFLKTIPHIDRDGLVGGDLLWATVCPRRTELINRVSQLTAEWEMLGLVIGYDTREGRVFWFPGFSKNQKGMLYEREAPSRYEAPPEEVRRMYGVSHDKLATNSRPARAKVEYQAEDQQQAEGEDQQQYQQQGQERPQKAADAARLAIAANLMDTIGILPSVISEILSKRPDTQPTTVAAWYVYTQSENESKRRRKERELTTGFVITQLRTGAIPPDWAMQDQRVQFMIKDALWAIGLAAEETEQ